MAEFITPNPPRKLMIEGIAVNILMSASDTNGLYGMIETIVPAGKGPLAHTHSREDESFYIVDGAAEFRLGEKRVVCDAGSLVYGPRGVTHGYKNVGDADLKILIVYTPGGVEESFQEWADAGNDLDKVKQIIAKYGITPEQG